MTQPETEKQPQPRAKEGEVQGEGDYVAGRRFQDAERSFAEKGSVIDRKAREAADALDGPEGAELEAARRSTGEGKVHPEPPANQAGQAADPHVEENLDKGLDETFPASDPVSISPGAD
ncbi:MAG TPA: hypothetical protein VGI95_14150 [Caulobacteraceae bacterium]|jgi:hypothetical protein